MKLVKGGERTIDDGGNDATPCTSDADCGIRSKECNGVSQNVQGHCHSSKKTCSWTAVC